MTRFAILVLEYKLSTKTNFSFLTRKLRSNFLDNRKLILIFKKYSFNHNLGKDWSTSDQHNKTNTVDDNTSNLLEEPFFDTGRLAATSELSLVSKEETDQGTAL